MDEDAQPWFARGAHLRGGANSSVSTLPSMYQTEPFIMPTSEPQSYYNFSPTPTPRPYQYHQSPSSFQRPQFANHASSRGSITSLLDNAPVSPGPFGYGLLGMHGPSPTQTSSESKHSVGPHGRPPSRTPSGRAIPQRTGPGMPPVSSPDPPTRVARDSEDFSPDAEEASPNPFEHPVVDIPPTYASVRRASIRRSLDGNGRPAAPFGPRPGGGLHRSNARRMSYRSEDVSQGSHGNESS